MLSHLDSKSVAAQNRSKEKESMLQQFREKEQNKSEECKLFSAVFYSSFCDQDPGDCKEDSTRFGKSWKIGLFEKVNPDFLATK